MPPLNADRLNAIAHLIFRLATDPNLHINDKDGEVMMLSDAYWLIKQEANRLAAKPKKNPHLDDIVWKPCE